MVQKNKFAALLSATCLWASSPSSAQSVVLLEETHTVTGEGSVYRTFGPTNIPYMTEENVKPIRVDLRFSRQPIMNLSESIVIVRWNWECIVGPGQVKPCSGNSNPITHYLGYQEEGTAFSHDLFLYSYGSTPFTPEQIAKGDFLMREYGEYSLGATFVHFDYEGEMTYTIRFTLVPEPTSWALMITGFGLLGAVARRKAGGSEYQSCEV
jgi:hypothetical protein